MSFPITVSGAPGQYTAHLAGEPAVSAIGETREAALSELRLVVQQKVQSGELAVVDIGGWIDLAARYAHDDSLDEVCSEAYNARRTEPQE